jgi:uncharacterized membrane protein YoaK (UPF0700 family)
MYRLEREDFVSVPYISLWSMLSFQAGFINAFGFLACGRYVSHVTGFGTQIGVAAAEGRLLLGLELLGFPLSFILGAFSSGLLTSARLERGMRPRYDLVTLFLPLCLTLLIWLGNEGLFGLFGEPFVHARDFFLLFLLSFICGMQNSCFATLTKGQIRTTHLTGISTDMGTDFARLVAGRLRGKEQFITRRVTFCRVATFFAFSSGSIVSVFFAQRFEYTALILPLATSVAAALAIKAIGGSLDKKFLATLSTLPTAAVIQRHSDVNVRSGT